MFRHLKPIDNIHNILLNYSKLILELLTVVNKGQIEWYMLGATCRSEAPGTESRLARRQSESRDMSSSLTTHI